MDLTASRRARRVAIVLIMASLIVFVLAQFPVLTVWGAGGRTVIPGHLVAALRGLHAGQPTDSSQTLQLAIGLQLRDRAGLDALVGAQADVLSPWYHQYLTPQQFTDSFGPTQATVDSVVSFLRGQGIAVQSVSPNRALIDATASAATVEAAFQVHLADFVMRDGRQVYAPVDEPSVPDSLGGVIQSVVGLDDVAQFHHALTTSPATALRASGRGTHTGTGRTLLPQTPPGPGGGYTPVQLRTAYDMNTLVNSYSGVTQTVALFEEDGYLPSDINAYLSNYNLGNAKYSNVLVGFSLADPAGPYAYEVESDMEVVSAIAPAASQLIYEVQQQPTDQQIVTGYQQIVHDDLAKIVSTSWGDCESHFGQAYAIQIDTAFTQAAVQGQAIFAASGDHGSNDCQGPPSPAVDFPASDPHVIGVGGTKLDLNSDDTYKDESGWSDSSGASGGGNSSFFARPAFQQSLSPLGATGNWRLVPDVSADADLATGYSIYCTVTNPSSPCLSTGWTKVGGTSLAAPLWAGIAADTDDYLASSTRFTLGNAIGVLYQIYTHGGQYQAFHDITTGQNNGLFQPGTGYDLVTGIGSPDAWGFAQDAATIMPLWEQTPVTDSHEVFALDANHHVEVYHWSLSGGWSTPLDLTSLVGPSGVSFYTAAHGHFSVESGAVVQHCYAVGNDGTLYEYYNVGGTWYLTTLRPPSGVTFNGTPSSYSYSYPGDTTEHHSVFVMGSDSHLYHFAWAQGSAWTREDVTAAAGVTGVSFYNSPSAHWLIQSGGLVQDVYLVSGDGYLHEFYTFGGSATSQTLTWYHGTRARPPSGVSLTGTPSGFSWFYPYSALPNHSVFVLGTDFHLYLYTWSQGGTWTSMDLTATYGPSGTAFVGTPNGHGFLQSGGVVQDGYALTTQSQLIEYYWLNGAWATNPVSNYLSGTGVGTSASAYSYVLTGTTGIRHSVFFVGDDAHLHELYFVQSAGQWYSADHGAPPGTTLSTFANPSAYGYCSTLNC